MIFPKNAFAYGARSRLMIAVIICSIHRAAELDRTVASVQAQELAPGQIIISVPAKEHVLEATLAQPGVRLVVSEKGLTRQRNAGIAQLDPSAELVVFLDDDVELHPAFLREMREVFLREKEVVLCSGEVVFDGAVSGTIDREQACCVLEKSSASANSEIASSESAYGCNMAVRREVLSHVRFDERLPLYGWLEDADFSVQCARFGRVVHANAPRLVHLGVSSGRVSGRSFGYAQIINPLYLWRKGSLPSLPRVIAHFWLRAFLKNVRGAFLRDGKIDHAGRLRGNFQAFASLLGGRIAPDFPSS